MGVAKGSQRRVVGGRNEANGYTMLVDKHKLVPPFRVS